MKKFIFLIFCIGAIAFGKDIKPYDYADIKVDLDLLGSLKVNATDMNFGTVMIGTGPVESYSTLEIEEIGSKSNLPVVVNVYSKEKRIESGNIVKMRSAKGEIPVKIEIESEKNSLKNGKMGSKIKGILENRDKTVKEGVYKGELTVEVMYYDI